VTPDYALHPVAVHVFVLRGDQVLLLRRANTGYEDGKLSVPAGHVERGETVTGAALRETLEEVGLTLDAGRLRVVGVMHKSVGNRIDFFLSYALEMAEGEPSNLEPEKCSELLWSALRAPPADTISYVRAALANFIVGRWFDEHGGPLR
jgi:8-oxo-dGTP pyrophosphatase MutT (NUDIX family)